MSGQYGQNGPGGHSGLFRQSNMSTLSTSSTYSEIAANAALILVSVACSLLDRQLAAQAKVFEKEGGFTERLYHRRKQASQENKF